MSHSRNGGVCWVEIASSAADLVRATRRSARKVLFEAHATRRYPALCGGLVYGR